jgi:uncharacterized repeat protein (TIGR02543 family)
VIYHPGQATGGSVPTDGNLYLKHADATVLGNTGTPPLVQAGKNFVGWSKNTDSSTIDYQAGAKIENITGDVHLYAVFSGETIEHTVTYDLNLPSGATHQSGTVPAAARYLRHTTATLATPSADLVVLGYDFGGWTLKPGPTAAITQIVDITSDVTVYAIWNGIPIPPGEPGGPSDPGDPTKPDKPITYTVEYRSGDADGGTPPAAVEYRKHETVSVSENTGGLFKYGRNMIGWATTIGGGIAYLADGSGRIENISENYVLYPAWSASPTTYTITYHNVNGAANPNPTTYTSLDTRDAELELEELSRVGYTFNGWYTDSSLSDASKVTGIERGGTGDREFWAKWGNIPSTGEYKITYRNVNGAANPNPTTYTAADLPINLKDLTGRVGYTFNAWYTDDTYKTVVKTIPANTTGNLELWARWGDDPDDPDAPDRYTITYDAKSLSGGRLTPDHPTSFTIKDLPVGVPVASRNGYTFAGWYLDADGSTQLVQSEGVWQITTVGDKVLYARWSIIPNSGDTGIGIGDDTAPLATFESWHIPYIFGYPDGTVRPERSITRAEIAMIFFRLLADDEKTVPRLSNFRDVQSGAWYAQAVAYLENLGILRGYSDGTFKPNRPISRAEFAVIAARFERLDDTAENAFSDISSAHWAFRYINSAAVRGWVQGFPDGTFRPDERISRAQVVTVTNRMLQRILRAEDIPSDIVTFTDLLKSHWAYADIIEASTDHDRYDVRIRPDGSEVWLTKTA